jgi:hypothetical protein
LEGDESLANLVEALEERVKAKIAEEK